MGERGKGKGGKAGGRRSPTRGAAATAPKVPNEMTAGGDSKSWEAQKAHHHTLGDEFLEWIASNDPDLTTRWGVKWAEVPEAEMCATEIHGNLATFIA